MTKIKICGITLEQDARLAAEIGADAIGLNFVSSSPRCIDASRARAIGQSIPKNILRVGVFANMERKRVQDIARTAALDALQFHGDETPEYLEDFSDWTVIKALRLGPDFDLSLIGSYASIADYLLLDAFSEDALGGTGTLIQDPILGEIEKLDIFSRSFLAGGLTSENVAERVARYRPYAVDVSSGVESSPGKKDDDKIKAFISAVQQAAA